MTVRQDRSNPGPRVAEHHRHGDGVARIGYPIGVRRLTVRSRETLTARIVRVTLGGEALTGFPSHQADDHVKIVFPDADGTRRDPTPRAGEPMLDWPRPLPPTRSYTVRRHDPDAGELVIDAVLHGAGLGSAWARDARPGDEVTVAGPPGANAFPHHRGHHVFAVDETALPVVGRWLEEAPPDARADVVVEAGDATDHDYPLAGRDGVTVRRLLRDEKGSRLAEEVRALGRADAFLFAAGEAGAVKPFRRAATGGDAAGVLVTGYWKRGVADHDED